MHYFKRNIGDYHKKAGRLTMLQHGAYTLLIDSCYDREQFPTEEQAIDWCWASTAAEVSAVKFVLTKFFTLNGDKYEQNRIKEEVDRYHENSARNKQIALDREAKRREDSTNRAQSVNEPTPNQEPRTTNQEPVTKEKKGRFTPPSIFELQEYISEKTLNADPEAFIDFYESKGWMIGKNKMKSWKAAARTWSKRQTENPQRPREKTFDEIQANLRGGNTYEQLEG